ncbi:MAG: ATPase [Anaerolineales bacterium]|nr:ATPase [Anaerolineales bacterium]
MDILHLVDRLEELFNESRPIPLTHNVIVDEDRFLEIIDQMRISIPEEVKRAQQLETQRDRVLAQAQEEANRTIALAQQKGEELIHRDSIVQAGQARAEQIIDQARIDAEVIRKDADDYVIEVLGTLEEELTRLLTQARNGIAKLTAERQAATQAFDATEVPESPVGEET